MQGAYTQEHIDVIYVGFGFEVLSLRALSRSGIVRYIWR